MTMILEEYRNGGDGFIKWAEDNVCIPIYPEGSDLPEWHPIGNLPDDKNPDTGRSYRDIWESQKDILREALYMENGRFKHRLLVFCWPRGEGKCQEKGSKVLMFDGSVKKVEDVVVGDTLMGDDNTPRRVLSLANGKEEMYEVVPNRGESMVVTADHVLSLKRRRSRHNKRGKPFEDPFAGKVVDISLNDYQKQNKWFKDLHLLYRVPIDWPKQHVDIDPYFLGLWLGDGTAKYPHITTMDEEVVNYLYGVAAQKGLHIAIGRKKANKAATYKLVSRKFVGRNINNSLLNDLRQYNLTQNKHIPQTYKANSRGIRLSLLAGLVDSDGYINRNSIQFILKSKQLSEDIVFLARSLGFHSEIKKCKKGIKDTGFSGEYYRIGISGDCSIIPTLIARKKCPARSQWKDILVTGIKKIKSVGEREYYGFMLDGNGRYVTADFTVTHNSLVVCLIKIWKFLCWIDQKLVLGANSKDQIRFVHYDIIRDVILNSPNLVADVGRSNIREKEIRLIDEHKNIRSFIRPISSFTGIVSNVNHYSFSEMFDMKNPRFFTQLDGSIRNIPNAFGLIDSTVSEKSHILYKLYQTYSKGEDPTLFFSYRCSDKGKQEDYWHPNMTKAQLDSYRAKFPLGDFERYFMNIWSAGAVKVFTEEMIEATNYLGVGGMINTHSQVMQLLERKNKVINTQRNMEATRNTAKIDFDTHIEINKIYDRLTPVSSVYELKTPQNEPKMAEIGNLEALSDLYDTNWAIIGGFDRADPMKRSTSARTITVLVAKGLIGSRSKPFLEEDKNPNYTYILLGLLNIQDSTLSGIKDFYNDGHQEYDGIDIIGSERWGAWDLAPWCEDNDVALELWVATYDRQKTMFSEVYVTYNEGRFKTPALPTPGSSEDDILKEEASVFDHDPDKRWFGSPEKTEKYGIQDDAMFALGAAKYAGRNLTVMDFRERKGRIDFGSFFKAAGNLGRW